MPRRQHQAYRWNECRPRLCCRLPRCTSCSFRYRVRLPSSPPLCLPGAHQLSCQCIAEQKKREGANVILVTYSPHKQIFHQWRCQNQIWRSIMINPFQNTGHWRLTFGLRQGELRTKRHAQVMAASSRRGRGMPRSTQMHRPITLYNGMKSPIESLFFVLCLKINRLHLVWQRNEPYRILGASIPTLGHPIRTLSGTRFR